MGHHDNRIVEIDQKFFQPCDGIEIQMVGRFVEKKDIRIAEERLGEEYFHLLVTIQILHITIMKLCPDPQTV